MQDVYEESKLSVKAAIDSLEQKTRKFEDKLEATDKEIKKIKKDESKIPGIINKFKELLCRVAK